MFDLNHRESSDAENGNHKYSGSDSTDGGMASGASGGVGTSRRLSEMDEEKLKRKRKDLADLAVWMSGLKATNLPVDDPHDLCNGRAFAELLHEIDKDFFDEHWLEKMPCFTSNSNRVIKRSNLRKLWRKISDYMPLVNRPIPANSRWTDIDERVDGLEESDLPVAVDLAMIVVTLAHVGRTKEHFVGYSKEMSTKFESEMESVVRMICEVMGEIPESVSYLEVSASNDPCDDGNELNVSLQESSFATSTSNGHRRRTMSNSQALLEAQLDTIRKEKDQLVREVDRLTKALDNAQLNSSISSDANDISILEKQNEELRIKKRNAEEKVHELEGQLEQLRVTVEELTIQTDELRSGQKEANELRGQLHEAQDQIEEWRTRADQLSKEAEIGRKREKDVKDLQGKVKQLTSRLEHHVKQSTVDDDLKESAKQLRMQIGTLTGAKETLEYTVSSRERVIQKLENQLIQFKEKVKALEDRKDDLINERNALQEELLLKDAVTPRSLHESMFEGGNLSFEPFSEKSKLPLEVENKRLLERIQELEELEPLRGEIAVMNSRNGVLEEENLVISKQKEELAKRLVELEEKIQKSQQNVSGDVVELRIQLEKATVEVERLREAEAKAETRVGDVEHQLAKRSEECEKLNTAMNKAKTVIDTLEERCRPVGEDTSTSVHQFKELQSENERLRHENEQLKIRLETETKILEQENRLLTTAAHQMVLNRPNDDVMAMRAQGGSDAPQTLLETQKMSGALPWRCLFSSVRRSLPTAMFSLASIILVIVIAWFLLRLISELNAPPIA